MTDAGRRKRAYRSGRMAESVATIFLRVKGYRIRARNWRCPAGEIDIVASKGLILAFVEVKSRRSRTDAIEALGSRQQGRIRRAAEAFLAANPGCANMHARFDILMIVPRRLPKHIADAWG